MLSRRLNGLLFDRAFFAYLDRDFSFGRHFAAKAERALVRLPMKENYFLSYILLGRYYGEPFLPIYLRRENYRPIRDRLGRVEIVTASCERFFAGLEDRVDLEIQLLQYLRMDVAGGLRGPPPANRPGGQGQGRPDVPEPPGVPGTAGLSGRDHPAASGPGQGALTRPTSRSSMTTTSSSRSRRR